MQRSAREQGFLREFHQRPENDNKKRNLNERRDYRDEYRKGRGEGQNNRKRQRTNEKRDKLPSLLQASEETMVSEKPS